MKRIVLGVGIAAATFVGLAAPASAAPDARHSVCVDLYGDGRYLPPGYCIAWDDAAE